MDRPKNKKAVAAERDKKAKAYVHHTHEEISTHVSRLNITGIDKELKENGLGTRGTKLAKQSVLLETKIKNAQQVCG